MGLLQGKDDRNSGKAVYSRQNKKADLKLDLLSGYFASAAESRFVNTEKGLLQRRNYYNGFRYIRYIDHRYNFENRLFTVIYNHELSTEVAADDRFKEIGDCIIEVRHVGKLRVKSVEWSFREFNGSDEEKEEYIKRLSNPLITDRIKSLEIIKLRLTHKSSSGTWEIIMESILGSTTWMLLPPVTSIIKPTDVECIKFMELFELLADAAVNNRPADDV